MAGVAGSHVAHAEAEVHAVLFCHMQIVTLLRFLRLLLSPDQRD